MFPMLIGRRYDMDNRDAQAARDIDRYLDFLMLDTMRIEKDMRITAGARKKKEKLKK